MTEKLKNFWAGIGSVLRIHPTTYTENPLMDSEELEIRTHDIRIYLNALTQDARNIRSDFIKTYERETRELTG